MYLIFIKEYNASFEMKQIKYNWAFLFVENCCAKYVLAMISKILYGDLKNP